MQLLLLALENKGEEADESDVGDSVQVMLLLLLLLLLLFHHFTIFSYHYRPRWHLRVFREDGAGAAAVQVLHAKIYANLLIALL